MYKPEAPRSNDANEEKSVGLRSTYGGTLIERKGQNAYPFNSHGWGQPIQIQTYFLNQSELPVIMQVLEVPVGAGEGVHSHPRAEESLEEIYLVTKGTAKFTLNGEEHILSTGDAVLARPEDEHGMENIGNEPLGFMILWGRAASRNDSYGHLKSIQAAHAWREGAQTEMVGDPF